MASQKWAAVRRGGQLRGREGKYSGSKISVQFIGFFALVFDFICPVSSRNMCLQLCYIYIKSYDFRVSI